MPLDADAVNLQAPWAETGHRASPESAGLERAEGWPVSYEQVGGGRVERSVTQQLLYELSLAFRTFLRGGLPAWDSRVQYPGDPGEDRAFVLGSDGREYVSLRASGPAAGNATDPTTEAGQTYWRAR